jgi:hypothetical protein
MRSPKSSNSSNIADKLANGAYTKTLSKQEVRAWQLSQLKQILKETNNPKADIERALCGGHILPEFHSILLTILRPISSATSALILRKANIYYKLENKLIAIIAKSDDQESISLALQNSNLSKDSITQLIAICKDSKIALELLKTIKFEEIKQIELIKKLSDEDAINLHRSNIFYPETKLLSSNAETFLKDIIDNRGDINKNENAEIVFLDDK